MPYFTTAELRDLPDMADVSRFPDARLEAGHDWIAAIIERECETSFIATEVTETLSGNGAVGLPLSWRPHVLSVDSVSVNGVAIATPATTLYENKGVLFYRNGTTKWSRTQLANIEVTYTAGYSTEPPADLKEAALRGARNWLLTSDAWSGKDSRATAINNEYGNITLSVAGPNQPTGLPDVDATIMAWARRVLVPATTSGRSSSLRLVVYGDS